MSTSTSSTKNLELSHLSATGEAQMVDISHKTRTQREAVARSTVRLSPAAFKLLSAQENAKGEVFNTARIAGVLAAKRCADLIPMCHPLQLDYVGIDFDTNEHDHTITIRATCRCAHTTGVEMEALTACSVAALTVYDMCKAADKGIVIENTQLVAKSGGKSGRWQAKTPKG